MGITFYSHKHPRGRPSAASESSSGAASDHQYEPFSGEGEPHSSHSSFNLPGAPGDVPVAGLAERGEGGESSDSSVDYISQPLTLTLTAENAAIALLNGHPSHTPVRGLSHHSYSHTLSQVDDGNHCDLKGTQTQTQSGHSSADLDATDTAACATVLV